MCPTCFAGPTTQYGSRQTYFLFSNCLPGQESDLSVTCLPAEGSCLSSRESVFLFVVPGTTSFGKPNSGAWWVAQVKSHDFRCCQAEVLN